MKYFFLFSITNKSDNKLVKNVMDAAILTGLVAGIGTFNKSFTGDPSNSIENYALFTAVIAGALRSNSIWRIKKSLPPTPNS